MLIALAMCYISTKSFISSPILQLMFVKDREVGGESFLPLPVIKSVTQLRLRPF